MTKGLPFEFESDRADWIEKLQKELNPMYEYHTAGHTQRVVETSEQICLYEQLPETETYAVLYAALFHDSGFLNSDKNHEIHSAELALKHLHEKGYPSSFCAKVENLILATHLSYQACRHTECIICDADLEYLGTEDYFEISNQLRREWENLGHQYSDIDWLKLQVCFFEEHIFKTDWALKNRQAGKQKNLSELKKRLLHSK